jgi:hypothetical protein
MLTIESGGKVYKFKDFEKFNTMYFTLLRLGVDSIGYENDKELFNISEGKEHNAKKAMLYAGKRDEWRKPTRDEIAGALNQFRNLSALARLMGISRVRVSVWKRKDSEASISFLSWRYLCEFLGIPTERVAHSLEYISADFSASSGGGKAS